MNQIVDAIYTHTEGEPTCIVHRGIEWPRGDILSKRRYIEKNYDWLRRALMREPRGHKDMFGVFVTPPHDPKAHYGMVWMDGGGYMHMCGHGTIGLVSAIVSEKWMPTSNSLLNICLESTAGIISAETLIENDKAVWCKFENVPAFVTEQAVPLEIPGHGTVYADIAFGGNFFALIRWESSQIQICPENGHHFRQLGEYARVTLSRQLELKHPAKSHIADLYVVTFWHESERPEARYRCVHVFANGQLDRSPGGTGTSAMMAMLEARGELQIGETIHAEGLLGSGTFEGCLTKETTVFGTRAVIPTIRGSAHVTGHATWTIDHNDPVGLGFEVS
tara:strand:- start:119 stop:1120 length:1002 start_codon:yes stop_codon:yes gene_type:complete